MQHASDFTSMSIVLPFNQLSTVPPELQTLYSDLYAKIDTIISGGPVFDIRRDPTILRIILQAAMTSVENFRNQDDKGWNGAEKKRIALVLIKFVIHDLSVKGKIAPDVAAEIIANVDFWGGIAMDLACDAANRIIEIGQQFTAEVKAKGCKVACKDNCCLIC